MDLAALQQKAVDQEWRCTRATLEAFEIKGKSPKMGTGVIDALLSDGRKLKTVGTRPHGTVEAFCAAHLTGDFYVMTDLHAMALRDGILVDTACEFWNDRQILAVLEVLPRKN